MVCINAPKVKWLLFTMKSYPTFLSWLFLIGGLANFHCNHFHCAIMPFNIFFYLWCTKNLFRFHTTSSYRWGVATFQRLLGKCWLNELINYKAVLFCSVLFCYKGKFENCELLAAVILEDTCSALCLLGLTKLSRILKTNKVCFTTKVKSADPTYKVFIVTRQRSCVQHLV